VAAVRRGEAARAVARRFGVSTSTVLDWVERARGHRLDRVDGADRSRAPRHTRRTDAGIEDLVLRLRRPPRQDSDLGAFGAGAIHRALAEPGAPDRPSVRTINRILRRRGARDGRRRVRRPPPPRGWYLPDLAGARAELGGFDVVEGLVLRGGPQVEVLKGVSVHGGLPVSWPAVAPVTAQFVVTALLGHWREVGLPRYAQFDNDMTFQGTHRYPDALGRVIRACLSPGVVPVFGPPHARGFQAAIASSHGWWQAKVWLRSQHPSVAGLGGRSGRQVAALRRHRAARIAAAPPRRPIPGDRELDLQAKPRGKLIYLRRTDAHGQVEVLGQRGQVSETGPHRRVRAAVDLGRGRSRFYPLRRREPKSQPLVLEVPYRLPARGSQQ
jgi:transposase-like protein